jgi:CheY-like chemotaxis protein
MLRFLEAKGYDVSIAENGSAALKHLEANNVDLIFMDVQMPVMDGITATPEIRARERRSGTPPIPIIGLSGNARDTHADSAYRCGMNEYITKPVKKDRLYQAIAKF